MSRFLRLRTAVSLVLLAFGATACTGFGERAPSGTDGFAKTADSEWAQGADGAGNRLRIQRAWIHLVVPELGGGVDAVEALARELDAWIESENRHAEESATLVLRVPADRLEETLSRLEALGEVTYRRIEVSDVTDQVIDLDARRANLIALRDRLRSLLDRAESVKEVLSVEKELTRVQSEIDSLEGRLERLRSDVERARVEVTLREAPPKRILGPLGYLWVGTRWFVEKLFVIRPGEP